MYLMREIEALEEIRVVVALGRIAFDGFLAAWRDLGREVGKPKPRFAHGSEHVLAPSITLLGSYHPSQQNTFTGRLTAEMLDTVLARAVDLARERRGRRPPAGTLSPPSAGLA